MVIHIPHDGDVVPREYSDFIGEPVPLRDVHASELYSGIPGSLVFFPFSRLICDVERFEDRGAEDMERVGMGVCYERNARLEPMREVPEAQREEILERLYRPHHRRLAAAVDAELSSLGRCLIIDGHTFSPERYPYMSDALRPEVCVGYSGEDAALGKAAASMYRALGYDVAENRPFAGAIKPLARMGDPRVASVMIEVRQDMPVRPLAEQTKEIAERLAGMWYGGAGGGDGGSGEAGA